MPKYGPAMLTLRPTRPPEIPARKPLSPKAIWIMRSLGMPSSRAVTASSDTALRALPLRVPSIQRLRATSSTAATASSSSCTVRTWAPSSRTAAGSPAMALVGIA